MTGFESEKPTLYSIEEVAKATRDFDETRIIGQGGYGSVYYGVIAEKVHYLLSISESIELSRFEQLIDDIIKAGSCNQENEI